MSRRRKQKKAAQDARFLWGVRCYDAMDPEACGWAMPPGNSRETAERLYEQLCAHNDSGIISYSLVPVPRPQPVNP